MFFNDTSGFEEGYAKKDNLEIYYRDYGPVAGIPVLLVMGLGGQLTFWPPYMIKRLQIPVTGQLPMTIETWGYQQDLNQTLHF